MIFVIALAVLQPLIALPFVVLFRALGLDIVPLRAIIPAVQSAFVVWVILALGWRMRAGISGPSRNLHLFWYPALVAFAPVALAGTIEVPSGAITFYLVALFFTGLSEEGFARGIAIPALLGMGRWAAVLIAAAIFSAGHFTNLFFEDFSLLEWIDKFAATFGFGVLYGALFLRTGSLWPLVALHAIHDFSYLTSGTAGPYLTEPIDLRVHMALSMANVAYGVWLLAGVRGEVSGAEG